MICRFSVTEVFEGKITTRARMKRIGALLVAPGMFWLLLFLLLPIIGLAILSGAARGAYGSIDWTFSLHNFWRLLGEGLFGWSSDNLRILLRSGILAAVTTLICLVVGFPMAFWICAREKTWRILLIALVMVPSCTNLVIRTYAWMLLLGAQMPPAWLARTLGLIGADSALYPGSFAIYLGMASAMLPFAVLPLYTSVERLDWHVVEAARDLYAGSIRTFWHAIVPQVLPGLVAATVLTLVPSLGMFVVSDLLGGSRYMLVGNLIQQQFGAASDWPFGAMLGLFLVFASLASLAILQRWGRGVVSMEDRK